MLTFCVRLPGRGIGDVGVSVTHSAMPTLVSMVPIVLIIGTAVGARRTRVCATRNGRPRRRRGHLPF
ncbi:hypothetical protein [Pandoraea terrigena]|uniref:Uncharacterized protein n=1 Tax=Pandoraea terrigena TaxID=2508292 RepID=A0A5E4VNI6_9BURK|nr:hypothetical protein [Pandoraea terrigena]VVE13977.1 hypothetical protein PTE31013_02801 [Pandoraea terrigena]